jgi:hypothetical protein
LPELEKANELQEEMAKALLDEIKHCYNDIGSYSEKSMDILEKYYNKSWEKIIKDGE